MPEVRPVGLISPYGHPRYLTMFRRMLRCSNNSLVLAFWPPSPLFSTPLSKWPVTLGPRPTISNLVLLIYRMRFLVELLFWRSRQYEFSFAWVQIKTPRGGTHRPHNQSHQDVGLGCMDHSLACQSLPAKVLTQRVVHYRSFKDVLTPRYSPRM